MFKEKIKLCIDEWDPIESIEIYPLDKYELEINYIYDKFMENNQDKLLLGEIIYDAFNYYFGELFDKSEIECNDIAQLILKK